MNRSIHSVATPRPVTNCFLTRLHWAIAEHDRRTAEANARRETADSVAVNAAESRRALQRESEAFSMKGGANNG